MNLRGAFKTPTSLAVRRTRPGYATSPDFQFYCNLRITLIADVGIRPLPRKEEWLLISVKDLSVFWRVRTNGVVHVGAHAAEEQTDYEKFGFGPVLWVEAQPNLAQELNARIQPPSRVVQALIWDVSGEDMTLKITNNSQSSSLFEFGTHQFDHPDVKVVNEIVLKTVRLDEILPEVFSFNFLNIDIQGAEYQALNSLGGSLGRFDYVFLEVNRGQVYKGIKQVKEIDRMLALSGFSRVATVWTQASWGDALYIKKNLAEAMFGGPLGLALRVFLYTLLIKLRKSALIRRLLQIIHVRKSS